MVLSSLLSFFSLSLCLCIAFREGMVGKESGDMANPGVVMLVFFLLGNWIISFHRFSCSHLPFCSRVGPAIFALMGGSI